MSLHDKVWTYDGPVSVHGVPHTDHWRGATRATTAAKAMSNLKFKYRQQYNLAEWIPIQMDRSRLEGHAC